MEKKNTKLYWFLVLFKNNCLPAAKRGDELTFFWCFGLILSPPSPSAPRLSPFLATLLFVLPSSPLRCSFNFQNYSTNQLWNHIWLLKVGCSDIYYTFFPGDLWFGQMEGVISQVSTWVGRSLLSTYRQAAKTKLLGRELLCQPWVHTVQTCLGGYNSWKTPVAFLLWIHHHVHVGCSQPVTEYSSSAEASSSWQDMRGFSNGRLWLKIPHGLNLSWNSSAICLPTHSSLPVFFHKCQV